MIVIKQRKVEIEDSQLSAYQKQFEDFNLFICKNLFDTSLKGLVEKQLSINQFSEFVHKPDGKVIGQEYVIPSDASLPKILNFYLNHKDVLDSIKKISGIPEIKSFHGRVYRFEADQYSFDNWHNDMNHGRLLGMSLNLSDIPFEGGEFKIRNVKSEQVYKTVKHKEWGSAHFFRISDALEHKVEKVHGDAPRVAFAGWFNNQSLFK